MDDINLEEGKISLNDEWLSVDDIHRRIMEKMQAGDMKIADLAAALEKLSVAVEQSHPLDIRIVLPKPDYDQLKAIGEGDDKACLIKAIQFFIGTEGLPAAEKSAGVEPDENPEGTIPCAKCGTMIEIPSDERPLEFDCPFCGTSHVLEAETDDRQETLPHEDTAADEPAEEKENESEPNIEPRHKDHFIG